MSSNAVGILLILAIIVLGVSTGGAIFKSQPNFESGVPSSGLRSEETLSPDSGRTSLLSREINKAARQVGELKGEIDKFIENQSASIHKGDITITSVSRPGSFRAYVRITAGNIDEPVLITGWKLRSTVTGTVQVIGGASNLPYPGVRAEEPIYLPRRGKVVVSQLSSPIGTSFRTNRCTGFFSQNNNFNPTLDRSCPSPRENLPPLSVGYNDACLDYIERIPQCYSPTENDIPDTLSYDCEYYIRTQVNYASCVARHKSDLDFYRSEWRLFPISPRIFWLDDRDTIELIDLSGKVVDTYSY